MVVLMSKSIPGNKNEFSARISLKAILGSSSRITTTTTKILSLILYVYGKTFPKSHNDTKENSLTSFSLFVLC